MVGALDELDELDELLVTAGFEDELEDIAVGAELDDEDTAAWDDELDELTAGLDDELDELDEITMGGVTVPPPPLAATGSTLNQLTLNPPFCT